MSILSVTQELSISMHVQAVAEAAVTGARQMTGSEASYLLSRDSLDKPLSITAFSGQNAQKLFQAHEQELMELAENSLVTGLLESVCVSPESLAQPGPNSEQALTAAVALPLIAEGNANSSLVIADGAPDRRFGTEERDALTTLAGLTSVALHNADLQDSQRNFFTHITETLVLAMDAHVDGRKGHAHAVAQLANRLGRELKLPDDRMQTLHFAALLHDIGMLKIPAGSQRSPGHFQKHPVIGHRLLSRIRLWEEVAPIVLHHHEWFDGAGYPEGRVGRAIPIESRIISVADCLDCMLRDESHRLAMSIEEALAEIRRGAGKQFDPDVVVALAKLAERGELGVESS